MNQLKVNVAFAYLDSGACVVFGENCWWDIPASHQGSRKIAEAANGTAGKGLDSIMISGNEITFRVNDNNEKNLLKYANMEAQR